MNKYNSIVAGALDIAQNEALKRKNNELHPAHLMFGLLSNPSSFSSRSLKKYRKEVDFRALQRGRTGPRVSILIG